MASMSALLREDIRAHPGATFRETQKRVKRPFSRQLHSLARKKVQQENRKSMPPKGIAKPKSSQPPMELHLKIPDGGLVMKIRDCNGALGTVNLTREGLSFVEASGKKQPDRQISYERLAALFKIGLL